MRRVLLVAGVAMLCATLVSWAALAWAQPSLSKAPEAPAPSAAKPPLPGQAVEPIAPLSPPAPVSGLALPVAGPEQFGTVKPATPAPGSGLLIPPAAVDPSTSGGPKAAVLPDPAGIPAGADFPPRAPLGDDKPQVTTSSSNPTGRQEPAVSMEWVGPPVVKVGQAADFTLVVRNTCKIPVQKVLVQVKVPAGCTVASSEPKATEEKGTLAWDLATLMPGQEKNLQMKMLAQAKGDMAPQAWVTFTGSTVTSFKVREPKLTIKAAVAEKVIIGEIAAFTLTIANPGDGSAEKVKIHANLSEGLEHARAPRVDFEIGDLAAGDSRSVTLICGAKTGGMQHCEVTAEAEGGLTGKDTANVDVVMPRLDLVVDGPGLRYLDRKAIYTFKVANPGDAGASNVTVSDVVPIGFKVLAASDGGRHDSSTRTVSWFLGEIAPGQTREVKLEVQAVNAGEQKHHATVVGARGLKAEVDKMTRVEGISALMVEMVDTEDPVEVGGDTAYEVRITNTGSKTETDIKLTAIVPEKEDFKDVQGPVHAHAEGKTIVFDPIEKLAPHADAILRINVKAREQGVVYFKILVTSTNLVQAVEKSESTRIYSDAPEGGK
jgi:uncharacterized repeat protein (TIGR01451 family)